MYLYPLTPSFPNKNSDKKRSHLYPHIYLFQEEQMDFSLSLVQKYLFSSHHRAHYPYSTYSP